MAGYENKKEKNTHTFWKDGAKVVFLPLLEGVISVTRQTNRMKADKKIPLRESGCATMLKLFLAQISIWELLMTSPALQQHRGRKHS